MALALALGAGCKLYVYNGCDAGEQMMRDAVRTCIASRSRARALCRHMTWLVDGLWMDLVQRYT